MWHESVSIFIEQRALMAVNDKRKLRQKDVRSELRNINGGPSYIIKRQMKCSFYVSPGWAVRTSPTRNWDNKGIQQTDLVWKVGILVPRVWAEWADYMHLMLHFISQNEKWKLIMTTFFISGIFPKLHSKHDYSRKKPWMCHKQWLSAVDKDAGRAKSSFWI